MFSLKEMFDKTVKVTLDESWNCPWPGVKSPEDKDWCYQIEGKRGLIYPQTETHVCVQTTHRIAKKLMSLFGDKAYTRRDCDESIDVVIPVALTQSVFKYIKPRRRRTLTEEQKEVLKRRLRGSGAP